MSERAADRLAEVMGSWKFVLSQGLILTAWFVWNGLHMTGAWDLYPFILANLVMSAQAAFTAPIIMMSQNRQAASDRRTLQNDVMLDAEALEILRRLEEKFNGDH
jgi:uncharacterized membrane protein